MSKDIDVYLRNPNDIGVGDLLGSISVEDLPLLGQVFDTTVLGVMAPSFPVKVGAISHGTPRYKVTIIPG